MIRIVTFLTVLFLLLDASLSAQQGSNFANSLSAKLLFIDYGNPNREKDLKVTNGFEIAYHRELSGDLGLSLPFKLGIANIIGSLENVNILSFDALARLKLAAEYKKLAPYLLGGAGIVWQDAKKSNIQVPIGFGVNYLVGKGSYLTSQLEYRLSGAELKNNLQIGLGYLYRFGKLDADKDGIVDHEDSCPELPGTAQLAGCPDSDSDGITDNKDICPTLPGTRMLNGCPDSDKDGIRDTDDACPDLVGTVNGCPDSDEDGVADKDDICPDKAGKFESKGCPDTDGDGLYDNLDACPDKAGSMTYKGCPVPDQDQDGIADDKDRCPDLKGISPSGCPDKDKDSIVDIDDTCPDQPGPTHTKGCPELNEEVKQTLAMAMENVQFLSGKATLLQSSQAILEKIAAAMMEYPGYHLRIAGHTDNSGDPEKNLVLSQARAKTCFEFLVAKGIVADRIQYAGFGEEFPIGDNNTYIGRKMNRRVEFDMFVQ